MWREPAVWRIGQWAVKVGTADVKGASSLTLGVMSCTSWIQCISNRLSNDAVENQDSVVLSSSLLTASHWILQQECTHPGRLVTAAHKFWTLGPKFVGPQVWNSFHITLLEFLGWLLDFLKILAHLLYAAVQCSLLMLYH